jgi:hypothetical protein
LADQITRTGNALAGATAMLPVGGLTKGSARVFVDDHGRGVIAITGAAKGTYDLQADGQKVGSIDVPRSGEKTAILDHLPAAVKAFTLTAR